MDADQERYLLERSMEISSRELFELNERLENAQHVAALGYWLYDKDSGAITWSNEIYRLFGLDSSSPPPTFDEVMHMICEPDRTHLTQLIERAFSEGKDYEYEFQLETRDNQKRWAYVKGQPQQENNKTLLTGIAIDITTRKLAELEVAALHNQVLITARRAGMADVATAILHNVGNVLNSANVSVELVHENLKSGHYEKFFTVVSMLKEHLASLNTYLTEDPKGKLIPDYLIKSSALLKNEYSIIVKEVANLAKQLQHIRDIVAMQKNLSGVSGVSETIFLPEIIETALDMSGGSFEQINIQVQKNYETTPFISVDSSKLLQILVNLIQNAKDAVLTNEDSKEKQIVLSIDEPLSDHIAITVKDNGHGIAPVNINNVFSFGFTTKKNGHGFGLHSSALAAKELGGCLKAHSDGVDQGAAFILTLPLMPSTAHHHRGNMHER
jgi:PAS domain S-box-containing protein